MGLITSMAAFWLAMLVVFVLINRGIWVFTDVSKSMSMFMLEKALGPPIDFVEGKKGSAATSWIIQGCPLANPRIGNYLLRTLAFS